MIDEEDIKANAEDLDIDPEDLDLYLKGRKQHERNDAYLEGSRERMIMGLVQPTIQKKVEFEFLDKDLRLGNNTADEVHYINVARDIAHYCLQSGFVETGFALEQEIKTLVVASASINMKGWDKINEQMLTLNKKDSQKKTNWGMGKQEAQ